MRAQVFPSFCIVLGYPLEICESRIRVFLVGQVTLAAVLLSTPHVYRTSDGAPVRTQPSISGWRQGALPLFENLHLTA